MNLYCDPCDFLAPEHEFPLCIANSALSECPHCGGLVQPYVEPELQFSPANSGQPYFMASIPVEPAAPPLSGEQQLAHYSPNFRVRQA